MQEKTFQAYLEKRGFEGGEVESQVRFIAQLEQRLREDVPSWTFEDLNQASVQAVVDRLVDNGENTIPNLQALARYAYVINNDSMYLAIFQLLDGYEAMDQLYAKLGDYVGEDLRDMTFEGMPLPPLGVSNCEKARFAYRIMRRMTQVFEESTCREILKDSLRLLPEADYQEAKRAFVEICHRDVDAYLDWKGSRFIETLESHRDCKLLWFGQEITDDVIAFVRVNPQIGRGVREGNTIVETKIPYNTKVYLEETDPEKLRYHYCHCPWAKESLRKNAYKVSPIFCQCSAGFHKRPYEIIFDQPVRAEVLKSVLNGDDSCQFAIHLPVSVVT